MEQGQDPGAHQCHLLFNFLPTPSSPRNSPIPSPPTSTTGLSSLPEVAGSSSGHLALQLFVSIAQNGPHVQPFTTVDLYSA